MFNRLWRVLAPFRQAAAPLPGGVAAWPALQPEDVLAMRQGGRLPMDLTGSRLDWLRANHPESLTQVAAAADRVLAHRFSLLGAHDFEPIDPERAFQAQGYRCIDWRLDPVSGLRFPDGFAHSSWNMATMRPGLADIKLPWELARCQHWPTLAQAWQISADSRYCVEIANELRDFAQANPVGIGVNWVCTMDVALRAANWALALHAIREWDGPDDAFWNFACERLLEHGYFIRDNLEDKYEVTSNHFLSNVVGLLYVAVVFVDRPVGQAWLEWCLPMLEREILVQVLEDGADFESSIPYHRLVTELFLGAYVVCTHLGRPLSPAYEAKLTAMVSYLLGVLRPDGLMPQVGDADDGRLHILSGYGDWNPQDPRHLFGPAAAALHRPDWARHAGPLGPMETACWGFDAGGLPLAAHAPPAHVQLYPKAGHAVSRSAGNYLLVTNARVGTEGFGNHKHNDQLAFELHIGATPLIVDAGSNVYTGNPASRNSYRSTARHNTLMIDAVEQNEVNPEWLFRLFEKAEAEHLEFSQVPGRTLYRGRHRGYTRLDQPVVHERSFEHDLTSGALVVTDVLEGAGEHDLHWHFHLAPGVTAHPIPGDCDLLLDTAGGQFVLSGPREIPGTVSASAYSPSYGVEVPCQAVDFRSRTRLASSHSWRFTVERCPDAVVTGASE
jgi:hypothetical protein